MSESFSCSIEVTAPPETVFDYFIDAELMVTWIGDHAVLDAEPGGEFTLDIEGIPVRGQYLEVVAPKRVVVSWGHAGSKTLPPNSTQVQFTLTPTAEGGTLVEVEHRNLPVEHLPSHRVGWPMFMGRLLKATSAARLGSNSDGVYLRKVESTDLAWLAEVACDPALTGGHNWAGEQRDPKDVESKLQEEFTSNGLNGSNSGTLIVCLSDGTRIGDVAYRTEQWGPSTRSRCPAFGINLLPVHRGHGYGTTAQRLLVDYLFTQDPHLHRVQSDTAVDNPAERRALAKIGMVEEGIVRSAEFRNGVFHDHVLVSLLRTEWASRQAQGGSHD